MVDFFIAVAAAASSFIGLLFVAMSFSLNAAGTSEQIITYRRMLAEGAYSGFLNILFVSFVALIPNTSISYVLITMAIFSLVTTARVLYELRHTRYRSLLGSLSNLVYVYEIGFGIYGIVHGDGFIFNRFLIMSLFFFILSMSLARAWILTGVRDSSK